jgi:DNA polymerase III subunit gamma/tau
MATYQSLYRRYRPQRFDEVLGQDHVTKALRNAVRDGRVGHAYLFSGPRGTGKTSTARILAKVLNCAAPVAGEPCGECENCVAVTEGRVTDWLLEQDAASKSKVDDMRDLLERVPLGTSGTRKVIILDEVHMLSQGAENALLKTLEEPPSHVVFVLATTDPRKVRPTIRSRTQHFEFRLLPPDLLADHVRHVIDDAGLALDAAAVDRAVDHVIRSGGGSARDTLSALDQVAALGEVVDDRQPVDAILDALCDRDAGQVLVAVADALAAGRDPRTLGESLISALRDAFLSLMGAADEHLAPAARERAARVGERLGAPGLTRALEVLGEALTELSRKPDPRIVVEVALVRLTQPAADRTLDAVLDRLDRLERGVATGAAPVPPAPAAPPPASGATRSDTRSSPPVEDAVDGRGGAAAAARDALSTARGGGAAAEPPGSAPASAGSTTAGSAGRGSAQPTLGAVARGRRAKAKATGAGDASDASPAGGAGTAAATAAAASVAPDVTEVPDGSATSTPWPAGGPSAPAVTATGGGAPAPSATARAPGGGALTGDVGTAAPTPAPASGAPAGDVGTAAPAPGPASGVPGGDVATSAPAPPPASGVPGGEEPTSAPAPAPASGAPAGDMPTSAELGAAWAGGVLDDLPVKIRSKWRGGRWVEPDAGALRFAVPNEWHQKACDGARREVEQALSGHFGRPVAVAVVVEGSDATAESTPGVAGTPGGPVVSPPSGTVRSAPALADDAEEHIDPSELRDANDVATNGVDMLLREFGGGELVEEEP